MAAGTKWPEIREDRLDSVVYSDDGRNSVDLKPEGNDIMYCYDCVIEHLSTFVSDLFAWCLDHP